MWMINDLFWTWTASYIRAFEVNSGCNLPWPLYKWEVDFSQWERWCSFKIRNSINNFDKLKFRPVWEFLHVKLGFLRPWVHQSEASYVCILESNVYSGSYSLPNDPLDHILFWIENIPFWSYSPDYIWETRQNTLPYVQTAQGWSCLGPSYKW